MKRECWVLYYMEDYKKNQRFVELLTGRLKKEDITVRVLLLDCEDIEEALKKNVPQIVINRSRNAKVAERLEQKGIRVMNPSKVTKIANDKLRTYESLKGIVDFMPLMEKETIYPCVVKSRGGHGGQEVFLVHNHQEKEEVTEHLRSQGRNYICQQYCNEPGKDLRVYVIGKEIVLSMLRQSKEGFKSNYSLGGTAEIYALSEKEKKTVYKVLDKIDMDYGGIDFVFHNGELMLNEIEDAVGARMVYENTDTDIVGEFADYIVPYLGQKNGLSQI